MAEQVTLYRKNGRYYTAAGLADYDLYNENTYSVTNVTATRYTISVAAMDSASCTLWYDPGGSGTASIYTRTEGGQSVRRRENDNASASLSYNVYKVNGNWVRVYGAHPAYPGFSLMSTSAGGCVCVVSSNAARYALIGSLTVRSDDTSARAPGLQSGSAYDADKITYQNSTGLVWFGNDAAADQAYYVCCSYYWFYAISTAGWTFVSSPNAATRTVADGKKRALVTDVEDYNSGSNASLSVKASSGSLTFAYRASLRAGLGTFLVGDNFRTLAAWSGQTTDGDAVVLRGVNTKADGTGAYYAVGEDIGDVLTRRPSIATYDTRVTLYATYVRRFAITVEADGGSGAETFYYCPEEGRFFADEAMGEAIAALAPYTKQAAQFLGLFTAATGGTKCVDADGTFADGWSPEADCTLYAQWRTVIEVAFDANGGSGGDEAIWYDSSAGGFVLPNNSAVIDSVEKPALECFRFLGYFTAATGGTQCIDADGALLESFVDNPPSAAETLYAQWERVTYKLTLDPCGGTGGAEAVYCAVGSAAFYNDDQAESETDAVDVPARTGHAFLGYFTVATGGTQCIGADGGIDMDAPTDDATLCAQWTPKTYTVTFDYGIGTGSVETKEVSWNQAIGELPSVTPPHGNYTFVGWQIGGATVTAETLWLYDVDAPVLRARFAGAFGDVIDWFGLASDALVPISSDSGDDRQRLAVRHYGKFAGGDQNAPVAWRNPTVTYMVVKDTTVNIVLGTSYPAGLGVTGYMVTAVCIVTGLRAFPTVTVKAVANEGKDAINLFSVSGGISVQARARAQRLLNAVDGGGDLQALTLNLVCDPVVLAEDMRPCASDVVNGRIEVDAETRATPIEYDGPAAGGGFTSVGAPRACGGTEYTTWRISAVKEL